MVFLSTLTQLIIVLGLTFEFITGSLNGGEGFLGYFMMSIASFLVILVGIIFQGINNYIVNRIKKKNSS